MIAVELPRADDPRVFGGKAVSLGAALRAGLAVPTGYALGVELVDAVAQRQRPALDRLAALDAMLDGHPVAVRSSAVGEDSARASFAGQHLTRLNVRGRDAIVDAVHAVWASGRTVSAQRYRQRLGIAGAPRVAVVVQRMIFPACAGVLFTRNPVNGQDERVIEATWGLGEAVVSGLVTPDRWRVRRGGALVSHEPGEKDIEVIVDPAGGTRERAVDAQRASRPCLDASQLAALEALAALCERSFSGPSDLEWAFAGEALYLLQRRPVTR